MLHGSGYAYTAMELAGKTVAAELKDAQDAELEHLPADALDNWFARQQHLWDAKNSLLIKAAWILLVVCCSSAVLSSMLVSSLSMASAILGLGFSLSWLGLNIMSCMVPYALATNLRVEPEMLLSFPNELLYRRQLAAMRRVSNFWLRRYTVLPNVVVVLSLIASTSVVGGMSIDFLVAITSWSMVPILLLYLARDFVVNFVLLYPRSNSAFSVVVVYAGLLLLYFASFTVSGWLAQSLIDTPALSSFMMTIVTIPQMILGLGCLATMALLALRRRKLPAGYSGGILLDEP